MKITGVLGGLVIITLIACSSALAFKKADRSKPLLSSNYYQEFSSSKPLELKYSQRGSHQVAYTEIKDVGQDVGVVGIWYPKDTETINYPMIFIVNGSNTKASTYKPFFDRLASWGFVVVGTEDEQAGSGKTTSTTLDALIKMPNDTVPFDRINRTKVGVVGYSQGGAGAIRAATEYSNSNLFKAIFTGSAAYSLLAKNMGWGYDMAKVTVPIFMTAGTGSSDDSGAKDLSKQLGGVAPLASLVDNYHRLQAAPLKVRARVVGAEHWEMQVRTDGYMTAWMLCHLYGDEQAASVFLGKNAELLSNRNWQDVEKNQ